MSERQPIGLPTLLRRLNTANVLREIRFHGPISRANIVKATGLSQVTVNQIAIGLRKSGHVIEERSDKCPSRRGRRMSFLRFNAANGYVLGIDIAPAAVVVLVSDLDGKVVAEERRPVATNEQLHPQPLLALVRSTTKLALASAGISRSALRAAGIGVPGRVDPSSGRISFVPALPGWDGLTVGNRLARILDCPVVVENDMHLAILAEQGFGSATTRDNAVYLHLGGGIGLGILVLGELYRGAAGAAGEMAFIPVSGDDETPAGNFGRFEWAAGSTSFRRLGRLAAGSSSCGLIRELCGGDLDRINAQVVVEAARRGDPAAAAILQQVVQQLARGICAVQCILDPRIIILGGEVTHAGSFLVDRLNAEVSRITRPPVGKIVISSLGEHGVALGAVQVALCLIEERLFSVVPGTVFHHPTNRSVSNPDAADEPVVRSGVIS